MDVYLFQKINYFALKWLWLDTAGIFFAQYFEYVLVFCLLIFLIVNFRKYWKMFVRAIISAVLARFVIVELIRWLWQRPRPFPNGVPAFPSGHAAFYFALSTIVFLYNKKAGILFYIASFLICLGRVFIGLHWPSDILVGAGIGLLAGCLIYKLSQK